MFPGMPGNRKVKRNEEELEEPGELFEVIEQRVQVDKLGSQKGVTEGDLDDCMRDYGECVRDGETVCQRLDRVNWVVESWDEGCKANMFNKMSFSCLHQLLPLLGWEFSSPSCIYFSRH